MRIHQRNLRTLLILIPALGSCAVVAFLIVQWLSSRLPALYKHASSIDSYSTWSMYVVDPINAKRIIDKHHDEMAFVSDYMLQTRDVEQSTRRIFSIVVRSPTRNTPDWWSPPSHVPGRATENMLWYKDADYGVAQGCYTLYDSVHGRLWIYEYACQHDSLWPRGWGPNYGRAAPGQPTAPSK